MAPKNALTLIGAVALCELAGLIGSVFTISAIPVWYAGLVKPALNPPSWVFAPVWTLLYLLMGIALFLVWQKHEKKALMLFAVQLFLNTLWTPIFFGLHNPLAGLAVIVLLWFAVLATTVEFYKSSKVATVLLVPYLAWVTFALYLNLSIWLLN